VAGEDDDPLERLDLVKRAHLRAHKMDGVDGVLSAMTFVPAIPKRRSLTASAARGAIRSLISDPESSIGKLDFISRDRDFEVWRISLRMPQSEETDFSVKIAQIQSEIQDELSDSEIPVEVIMTGHVAIVQKAQQVLLRDLFRSFMAAFGIVAIVMIFVLRNFVGGILAMVPNLFPTVAVFGTMGLVRSPLDIGSVMTASVALGIAVDDTVHLLSRYWSRRARGFVSVCWLRRPAPIGR
jgi:predicted RND superfamily exporter protein